MIDTCPSYAVAVLYLLAATKDNSCAVHCDAACVGYATVDSTHCAVCTVHPVASATIAKNVTFTNYVPQNTENAKCTHSKVCLACPGSRNIEVASHTVVMLSQSCSVYTPMKPESRGAHLTVKRGAHHVTIVGPGTVTSNTWPLHFGTPLSIQDVTFRPQDDDSDRGAALAVTTHGKVNILGHALKFRALASVYGLRARPVKMARGSTIEGTAGDAVVGLGHVSGHLDVTCHDNTSYVVMQELVRTEPKHITFDKCTQINLTKLLGFYGTEYEQMLFGDYGKENPPWRAVWTTFALVLTLVLVIILEKQPAIEAEHKDGGTHS